jgi:hypothetical protein
MMQKHRISTNIGEDQKVTVELKQDYDLLEILSLKFSQKDAYTSLCADYGVVCGRISVNNGLGVPNARVSIFVPQKAEHADDPVISALYPYTSVTDRDDNGYRYNLLPSRKQHGGHEPTGTFFDQSDILNREEVLEVFETYYSYTVKTNSAGDFMIWGVPLGKQTIHVDVDLSDIGCFSLRPDDFIRQGRGVDSFKSAYQFKSSTDYGSLPQLVSFDQTIEVYPFWGNLDLCEIGITRTDFDLSDKGVKIEPKAYFLGSVYTDQGNNAVNKNCTPRGRMGQKCNLTSEPALIEVIRFTSNKDSNNRPILETYEVQEDVTDDGAFVLPLPMNMDYLTTDEFGENVITNDPNKGIPTSACYRFRISLKNADLGRVRTVGNYLIPNIREYNDSQGNLDEKSYSFSTDWSDYPEQALNDDIVFNHELNQYYPQDYFYRFQYNKVYGVSSFMGSYFSNNGFNRHTYLGLKEISPKEQEDCESSVVTPPVNWAIQNFNFQILLAIIINIFERLIYYAFIAAVEILIIPFQWMYKNFVIDISVFGKRVFYWAPFSFLDSRVIEPLQVFGTVRLGIAIYPECETCDNLDYSNTPPTAIIEDPELLYNTIATGTGIPDTFMSTYGCSGYSDSDANTTYIYIDIPGGSCASPSNHGPSYSSGYSLSILKQDTTRYIIKFNNSGKFTALTLDEETISGKTVNYFYDGEEISHSGGNPPTGPITYKIFDTQSPLAGGGGGSTGGLNSELEGGCQSYVTVYNESIVTKTYCVTDPTTTYANLPAATSGVSCSGGKVPAAQVIGNDSNPCQSCKTYAKSGFSEFRYGLFTIIPAAEVDNWGPNFGAITEYANRKLVAKLFCEGIANYSFLDNWLTGSLYFFPFKSKIRWDDEQQLDLNVARTDYCKNLVHFKTGSVSKPDKRFYYRSSYTQNGTTFLRTKGTLGHPTTIVDLGPRDEFIKEICLDPSLDPNCSVVRSIGPSSYKNHKEMLGLYINYKLDSLDGGGTYNNFFDNTGFDEVLPNKMDGYILNGDILQLISINNEVGIEEFDLQNRSYSVYNPRVLDNESYPTLLDSGPIPINMILEPVDGYRVRQCLNEPGNLTESSQKVPFFYWNKGGTGFGSGNDQAWDYTTAITQPLQGMTYGYKYSGDTTHPYILFPMTKEYSGTEVTISSIQLNENTFDIVSTGDTHNQFNMQEEGFTFLYVTGGTESVPTSGVLYTRIGDATANGGTGNWDSISWNNDIDYIIKPTTNNYSTTKQILSTPFLFYFGLRPGKTAVDKFMDRFGPKGAFPSAE